MSDEPMSDEPMSDEPMSDEPMSDEPMSDEPGGTVIHTPNIIHIVGNISYNIYIYIYTKINIIDVALPNPYTVEPCYTKNTLRQFFCLTQASFLALFSLPCGHHWLYMANSWKMTAQDIQVPTHGKVVLVCVCQILASLISE